MFKMLLIVLFFNRIKKRRWFRKFFFNIIFINNFKIFKNLIEKVGHTKTISSQKMNKVINPKLMLTQKLKKLEGLT